MNPLPPLYCSVVTFLCLWLSASPALGAIPAPASMANTTSAPLIASPALQSFTPLGGVKPSVASTHARPVTPTEAATFNAHSGQWQQGGNESIDTFSGALRLHYVDIDWPGQGGLAMQVVRTYAGFSTIRKGFTNEFGVGWSINAMRLIPTEQNIYLQKHKKNAQTVSGFVLQLPSGQFKRFVRAKLGLKFHETYLSADNWRLHFSDQDVHATVVSPSGQTYSLKRDIVGVRVGKAATYEWTITREQDVNGNYIDYEYEYLRGANRLSRMLANDGREIKFNYDRMHSTTVLASIRAGDKLWRYTFDKGELQHGKGRVPLLHKVTRPDGLATQYYYHCYKRGCQVQTIIHPTGGRTRYAYQTYHNVPEMQSLASKTLWVPNSTPHAVVSGVQSASSAGAIIKAYQDRQQREKDKKQTPKLIKVGQWRLVLPKPSQKTTPCGPYQCVTTRMVGPDSAVEYQHAVVGRQRDYIAERGNAWQHGLLVKQTTYNTPKATTQPLEVQEFAWSGQAYSTQKQVLNHYVFDNETQRPLLQRKTITRDGSRYITQYEKFNDFGQPERVSQQGPDGKREHQLRYHHDWQHWIIDAIKQKTTPGVGVESFEYDKKGRLTQQTRLGVSTAFAYDAAGQLIQKTDALGRVWRYQDYYRGKPQTTIRPDGSVVKQTLDTFGRKTHAVDALGQQTRYQYDALDRITRIVPPSGAPTHITYNTTKGVGSQRLVRGRFIQTTTVDFLGRKAQVIIADSNAGELHRTMFNYDAQGREIFASRAHVQGSQQAKEGTYRVFDALNRLVETGLKQSGKPAQRTRFTYLPKRTIVRTDAEGHAWRSRYLAIDLSAPNLLVHQVAPNGDATHIERNAHGDITTVKQGDFTQQFEYDARYHLLATTTPEQGRIRYQHNVLGQKTAQTQADGQTTYYHYDTLGRLRAIEYPDGETVQQQFDANGNLIENSNAAARWQYRFDANNRLTRALLSADGQTLETRYHYDAQGNLSTMIYPDGRRIDYAPDGLGRATRVGDLITQIEYAPSGVVKRMRYANGVVETNTYDALARLTEQQLLSKTQKPLLTRQYRYDKRNLITHIQDSGHASLPIALNYDAKQQLVGANGPWGKGQVRYDALGNITHKQMGAQVLDYHYDTRNRLARISGSQALKFTYDTNGNVIDDGIVRYRYDAANQLRESHRNGLAEHYYDGLHHRVQTDVAAGSRYYFTDLNHRVLFETEPGDIKQNHIYVNGQRVASIRQGRVRFLHHDVTGTVIAHTERDGERIGRHYYLPFGAPIALNKKGEKQTVRDANAWQYGDRKVIPASTVLDFTHRVYSPLLGRFMNIDPVSFKPGQVQSFNRYSYALNNPYAYTDPNGEFSIPTFLRDFFDGFIFGVSWRFGDDDPHAESWSFYAGASVGASVYVSGIGQTLKGMGLTQRAGKVAADKLLKQSTRRGPLWAKTNNRKPSQEALRQWKQHQSEFPELNNAKEYVELAHAQWLARNQKMSTRLRSTGDVLFYNNETNTYTLFSAEGVPKTQFRLGGGA